MSLPPVSEVIGRRRLIITGGAGFIGSNLVRKMVRLGHEVLNIDCLTYAGNLRSLADVMDFPNHHFLKADLNDARAMEAAVAQFRPEGILHLAAESHVDRSIDNPQQFVLTNVVGSFNLLQAALMFWQGLGAAERSAFRFLHVSTDEVYGSLGLDGQFSESSGYEPHSPYSASKASADHFVRAWHATYGLPTLIANSSNNFGPYQFPEKLIPLVVLKCLRNEPVPVFGSGQQVRDWLHVDDHCEALRIVLECGAVGESYNIGSGCELRNIDLIRSVCQLLDGIRPRSDGRSHDSVIEHVADRPGHDLRYSLDTSKIRNELGWRPRLDHATALRQTIQWYLDHPGWWEQIVSGSYRLERLGTIGRPNGEP